MYLQLFKFAIILFLSVQALSGQTLKEFIHFDGRAVATETRSVNGAPQAVGVSPSQGSGYSQTFQFTYTDGNGGSDVQIVRFLINSQLNGAVACYGAYVPAGNVVVLVPDNGNAGQATAMALTGGTATLSNSQCVIHQAGSSATVSGNSVSLQLNISFTTASTWAGRKVAWMEAVDLANVSSGWQALGVWQVPGAPATTAQVTAANPARRAGSRGVFSVTFAHASSYSNLGVQNVLINSAVDGANACFVAFLSQSNDLLLVSDAGDSLTPLVPSWPNGPSGTFAPTAFVANSQCRIYGATSSYSRSGNSVTLQLDIELLPAFSGNRIVFAGARTSDEVGNSGWQAMGTWSR